MVAYTRRRLLACFLAIGSTATSSAFLPSARTNRIAKTNLQVIPSPDDLSSLGHAAHDFFASTSTLMSDAAVATADEAVKEAGWWENYLQIFKNILITVHTTVDGPLRSAGIENTWGISIALFTCSMRALLIPLSIQQNKNSEYMKALKPYMDEIKEKFKDNEDARNSATGKLLEDANQNPLAGCALSLVQLPILLGLYRGIRLLAIDGQLEEPFLWIPSLQGPVSPPDYRGTEWLTGGWTTDAITGYPVPGMGWETTLAFLALPALLVLLQTITLTILQPPVAENMSEEEAKTNDTTQLVFKFLPLMLGFFSLQVPAGLTIYWVTTNIFTLSQSLAVRAYFAANPPDIKLPDYWDTLSSDKDIEDMTPEERRQAVQAGLSVGPTMADLTVESRYHNYIARTQLRTSDSPAYQLVMAAEGDEVKIPTEMESWVGTAAPATPVTTDESAPVAASA